MALTPREFSFATPADLGGTANYRRLCQVARLDPIPGGWGLLHCTRNDNGARVTLATEDVDYVRLLATGAKRDAIAGLTIPDGKFTQQRDGWPDPDWLR
ncbi:MAG TPA: hypothetical protein VHH34_08240 [Pseudonocardiaceae bacterium]|nr:hypothetical protein [Pseudonocardiaceae bacterium]